LLVKSLLILLVLGTHFSCALFSDPYVRGSREDHLKYKRTMLPLRSTQVFHVIQGAFGRDSHDEAGNEYSWDFAVPFGTDVVAVEGGRVIDVFRPKDSPPGACDPSLANFAHNIKIEHLDGTVAQYVHVEALVAEGSSVTRGETIAKTANNGWLCEPHLHFSIYRSREHLYHSSRRETVPLYFEQVPGGILKKGFKMTDQF